MAGSTFKTNPFELNKLLDDCQRGCSPVTGLPAKLGLGRRSNQELDSFDFAGISSWRTNVLRHGGPVISSLDLLKARQMRRNRLLRCRCYLMVSNG